MLRVSQLVAALKHKGFAMTDTNEPIEVRDEPPATARVPLLRQDGRPSGMWVGKPAEPPPPAAPAPADAAVTLEAMAAEYDRQAGDRQHFLGLWNRREYERLCGRATACRAGAAAVRREAEREARLRNVTAERDAAVEHLAGVRAECHAIAGEVADLRRERDALRDALKLARSYVQEWEPEAGTGEEAEGDWQQSRSDLRFIDAALAARPAGTDKGEVAGG